MTRDHESANGGCYSPGKTLLLVGAPGSRYYPIFRYSLEEVVRVTRDLNLRLVLLDRAENRPVSHALIPDNSFIAENIERDDPESIQRIINKVEQYAKTNNIHWIYTILDQYSLLVAQLNERCNLKGNSVQAVLAAKDKLLCRKILSSAVNLMVPFAVVKTLHDVPWAYWKLSGGYWRNLLGNNSSIVMKPPIGTVSQGVRIGITSKAQAIAAYQSIRAQLAELNKYPSFGISRPDQSTDILMELDLTGPSVWVELVRQGGKDLFWAVSDVYFVLEPPSFVSFKRATYPSQLSLSRQREVVKVAGEILDTLGLLVGNFLVQMVWTHDGPKLLEVNPRMGGGFIWSTVKAIYGISLIEQGIRALIGLPVSAGHSPNQVMEIRPIVPKAKGTIVALEGLDRIRDLPGVSEERIFILNNVNDTVEFPHPTPFQRIGQLAVLGNNSMQAKERMLTSSGAITIRIRTNDGSIVEQHGDYQGP